MCGIAGIFNIDDDVKPQILKDMAETINHRGPDASGEFIRGKTGVAHKRLSIIDIQSGQQPMWDKEHRYIIVFNGEIYNYLELRQELVQAGCALVTHSDTEVLLNLYIIHGPACLQRCIGMFAFAIYDIKEQTAFLAVDRFGIKPLYYIESKDGFLFASEIKALLKHPAVKAGVNSGAMYEYLTFQFFLYDRTLFHGIRKLEPGTFLIIKNGKIERKSIYWELKFDIDSHHTEDYFIEKLGFLLQDSVRLQLRSDVPVGAYLSGGLDSSAITCYASQLLGTPISTFTGGFKESDQYDESGYARIVSEAEKTLHHEVFPTAQDFVDIIGKLIYFMDQPAAGPGLFPQYFVSKMASQNVKVVLGGQGGDEIFGGYARYLVAYLEQCLKSAIYEQHEEGRFVVTLGTIIPNLSLLKNYVPLIKNFWSNGIFEPMDKRYFQLINRLKGNAKLFSPDFLKSYDESKSFETFAALFNQPETKSYFNKMTCFDMRTLLPALLQVEDRMSMAVSLESRVPLLDHRIVELVASMPPTLKFAEGKTKQVFRQVVKDRVPPAILNRKDKMGFPVPLSEWFKAGVVRDFVLDTLLSDKSKNRGLLNQSEITNYLEQEKPFDRGLWGALCLELWYQNFIDV